MPPWSTSRYTHTVCVLHMFFKHNIHHFDSLQEKKQIARQTRWPYIWCSAWLPNIVKDHLLFAVFLRGLNSLSFQVKTVDRGWFHLETSKNCSFPKLAAKQQLGEEYDHDWAYQLKQLDIKSPAANNSLSKKNKSRKLQKNPSQDNINSFWIWNQTSATAFLRQGLRPFFPRCSLALAPLPHSNEQGWAEKLFGIGFQITDTPVGLDSQLSLNF